MELIFDMSKEGRKGYTLPARDVPKAPDLPKNLLRSEDVLLPSVTENEVVRHFTNLSIQNYNVDRNFYPLGSCTMKYNPKFTEAIASREEFTSQHPLLPQLPHGVAMCQGSLAILKGLEDALSEVAGMDAFTLQPLAGAHGELTGIMLIAAYHRRHGNKKKYVLIPDGVNRYHRQGAGVQYMAGGRVVASRVSVSI